MCSERWNLGNELKSICVQKPERRHPSLLVYRKEPKSKNIILQVQSRLLTSPYPGKQKTLTYSRVTDERRTLK